MNTKNKKKKRKNSNTFVIHPKAVQQVRNKISYNYKMLNEISFTCN